MLERHVFARRPNLEEEDYAVIEKFGQKHYECQFVNDNAGRNPSEVHEENKCGCGC